MTFDDKPKQMPLPNDYRRSAQAYAEYTRSVADNYRRYMDNKVQELFAEAERLTEQANAEPDPKKAKKLADKAETKRSLAPLVDRDGRTFQRAFRESAERKLREDLDADMAQLDRAGRMLNSLNALIGDSPAHPQPQQERSGLNELGL